MKKRRGLLLLTFGCWLLMCASLWAQPEKIRGVFGSGGGITQDASIRLTGTFGQALAGKSTGAANQSWGGFWYTIRLVTVASENPVMPTHFSLDQSYPNPCSETTTIRYGLPAPTPVVLTIYDLQGRQVGRPVVETQQAGFYELKLNAGSLVPGMYFYRLKAGGFEATRKLVVVR